MNRKRKANPIIVIFSIAIVLVLITIAVVYMMGGRFTTLANGAKFMGEWDNNQPITGTIKYQNGTEATIDYFSKTITYNNGDVYTGDIVGGCRHGQGVMKYSATGDVYEGTFVNDEITGTGTFKYANGDVYQGAIQNSKKHGYGVFTYANGNTYEGEYENDVRSGKGEFTWGESGAKYTGDFANDLKNGEGVMIYENGDRYDGQFKDDMRHGNGNYFWSNGEHYNGTFINNLMDTRLIDDKGNFSLTVTGEYIHGANGIYTFATGRKFTGAFLEGKAVIIDGSQISVPENDTSDYSESPQ